MTCTDFQEWISADLDGELPEGDGPILWAHLARCANCRQWRRDLQGIRTDFAAWPEDTLPASVTTKADDRSGQAAGIYRVPRLVAWAAVLAVFVEAVYIASSLGRATPPAQQTTAPIFETVETITLGPADRVRYRVLDRGSATTQSALRKTGG